MKPIRGLATSPDGLTRYRADTSKTQTWSAFRKDGEGQQAYAELSELLVNSQRGLCCYCEIRLLVPLDRQIEHVKSREHHPDLALDYQNMLAACTGGSSKVFVSGKAACADRAISNSEESLSCGQKKLSVDCLDPRSLPVGESLFKVTPDGRVIVDAMACENHGIDVGAASQARDVLGLDNQRLRNARKKIMGALAAYNSATPTEIEAAARDNLLPGNHGQLNPWFTTSRSYFGAIAEKILAETPQDWIAQ
jgi:uncharacterized protein (TIGR02646 family)